MKVLKKKQGKRQGALFIMGGGPVTLGNKESEHNIKILAEFMQKAGKVITVITTGVTDAVELKNLRARYKTLFVKLGAKTVHIVNIVSRQDAESGVNLNAIADAEGIFFTGGDQLRITTLMAGSSLHQAIIGRRNQGVPIAGISAGAAMMSDLMFIDGDAASSPRYDSVRVCSGMALLFNIIIDSHFFQRKRPERLMTATATNPRHIGFGIDENTALVVNGNRMNVIGCGTVMVVDARKLKYSNVEKAIKENICYSFRGMIIDVLAAGGTYDLKTWESLIPKEKM